MNRIKAKNYLKLNNIQIELFILNIIVRYFLFRFQNDCEDNLDKDLWELLMDIFDSKNN